MASSRRAVLTGIGVLTPLGHDLGTYWQALLAGTSGIRRLSLFDVSGFPVQIGGEIADFDAKNFVDKKDRKGLRVMARTIQLAVAAAQLALNDSAVDKSRLDPLRFGVEFGCGLIASELEELAPASLASANCQPRSVDLERWAEQGLPTIPPLWMLKYLPNMCACHISILHNAQGPNNSITESDIAGLMALGEAFRILQRDQADFFLVGGAESKMNPLSLLRQCVFQPLSRRNDTPETACRPFDRSRDGGVLGEGATVLTLEELEHARRRGARIYAEVVGFGASTDTQRNGAGLARALRAALNEAGIGPEDIDHVNAHGYGSVAQDAWEARGLHEVFGACRQPVPVFAAKSYVGSLGAGGGPTEVATSVLALHHGVLPPTRNFEQPDPECPVHVAAGAPRPVSRPYFIKLGFTDMGQAAAIVCKKWT
jgi:3-oxoacyl-[acyl-carrier-protein] synthase II